MSAEWKVERDDGWYSEAPDLLFNSGGRAHRLSFSKVVTEEKRIVTIYFEHGKENSAYFGINIIGKRKDTPLTSSRAKPFQ